MREQKDDRASRADVENPEWTDSDFSTARPALEVISELFGEQTANRLRRGPGRPTKDDKKVSQNLRLDRDVLEAYKQQGRGWQTRINQVLREHMPPGH